MRLLLPFIFLLFFVQCTQQQNTTQEQNNTIRVAVFNGHGGAQTCIWETVAALVRSGNERSYHYHCRYC